MSKFLHDAATAAADRAMTIPLFSLKTAKLKLRGAFEEQNISVLDFM